ncbi:MAG TPA: methanol/ethanol family PQQ-dependent dehydrogenase [Gemmatimonadales bacterium]|nr:methanol/ethanol family PQQ-dependent dehydrogenase [Gemmatimonadales bacterium]
MVDSIPRSISRLVTALALALIPACEREAAPGTAAGPERARAPAGAIQPAVATPEDGEWRMPARDYASTRYSGLDQITAGNVSRLQLAWTFSTGVLRGHEAAPIVANNTMYIVTPHPNILYALDLERGGALKWKYEPGTARAAKGVACCDVVNRGAAYADGRIFYNTLDVHTVAVDAETGEELWKTKLGDINRGESMTMAPLVVKGKVLVGNSGGEFGVRGWITALEAETGEIAWRGYSTGPDSIVLIGDDFRPFYEADRAKDLGVTTWTPDQWKLGGGAVWGWISYDPELDLIYHGTSNPGVWNPALRPGDNKWASSIFARDPDDGSVRWAYQLVPHDMHDYDGINESILLDMPIDGRTREVLVRPERNGFVYVMDRATGEVISADTFGHVTWADSIDLRTGRPVLRPEAATGNRAAKNVCPAAPGMKDWQPSSFSPRTGLLYLPHNNLCMDYEGVEANFIAGTPYVGAEVTMFAGPGGHRGVLAAWDPIARRKVWEIEERFPVWSGTVVTAGDVVFYGTMDRWFKAVNARTGEPLWQFQVGSGIIGQPVTYRGPDGRQYVAILSGVGGWAGAAALGIMPEEDPTTALGFANAMKDLPDYTAEGGMLYVFALPAGDSR